MSAFLLTNIQVSPQDDTVCSRISKRMNNSNDITITIQDSETKEKVSLNLIGYAITIRKILEMIKRIL